MFDLPIGRNAATPESIAQLQESLARIQADVSSLSGKVDALLKHAGIEYDQFGDRPEGVSDVIRSGDMIQAIKLYREANGSGLKEEKDYLEEVRRQTDAGA